ncbi:MAG: ATP-binding cassette domain-containing protein, partial [Candidatus Ornithospirochaeta sp.]
RYESYSHKKNPVVLEGIDLCVEKGEKVLILGEPESGKTTLAMVLSSLVPRFQDGELEGKVEPDGAINERIEEYTLVPQNASDFIISETVEDEIAYPLESLGVEDEEMKRRLDEAIRFWGLESLRDVSTGELSGGEKRRLMLASSLITNPKYVIYDESFDDLDPHWREVLISHIHKSDEASLVFASRPLSLFYGIFHRTYILENGRLREWKEEKNNLFSPKKCGMKKDVRLECRDIEFIHPRRSKITSPFALSVPEFVLEGGEVVALMGPNGSGKSTFSRLLCGLEKENKGYIEINGERSGSKARERNIGYMFQNPDYQIFLPTVRDELMYSLSFLKKSSKEKEKEVEETADLFSLDLGETASLMSYGARKRLQSAIYYALDRPFYILDELDSALSYEMSLSILEKLSSRGAGILLITHDNEFASIASSRRYRAEGGKIVED